MTGSAVARRFTETQARRLTERIRSSVEEVWSLLLEAEERGAPAALGYDSFQAYVETEFGLSRGQAYRLLDQGRVVRELSAAASLPPPGVSRARDTETLTVSARAAAAVKPALAEVSERVREATKGRRRSARPAIVAGIVEEHRASTSGVEGPTPGVDPRVAAAAVAIPKLVRLDARLVAEAIPSAERGKVSQQLRRWVDEFDREARGFAKTERDRMVTSRLKGA